MADKRIISTREAPSYSSYSDHDQEALLSQMGNFPPAQRTLFRALCDMHLPEIKYRPFAERMSLLVKNVHGELEKLVDQLKRNKIALFTYSGRGDERKIDSIILTERGDPYFYLYSLSGLCSEFGDREVPSLPLDSVLEEEGLSIPDEAYTKIGSDALSKSHIGTAFKEPAILSATLSTKEEFLFVSSDLNGIIQLCIKVIKDAAEYGNILTELARFKNSSIGSLKQMLQTRDPVTWLELTEMIDKFSQSEGAKKEVQVREGFYQAAEFLRIYLFNEVEEAKRKKKQETEIETDFEAIVLRLKNDYTTPIDQDQMDGILGSLQNKYGDYFPTFSQRFYESKTKSADKKTLPPIVVIARLYIHRDHVHPYTSHRLRELARELEQEYMRIMGEILKSNNRDGIIVFHSVNNLDDDIRQKLEDRDNFISGIIDKPRILAEAIIHTAKSKLNITDIDKVRTVLERYFRPGTMRYRDLNEILHINIYVIYRKALSGLSVLRQFWMKLTGKYKTNNEAFESFRPRSEKKEPGGAAGAPEREHSPGPERKPRSSPGGRPVLSGTGGSTASSTRKARSVPGPSGEKTYKKPAPKQPVYTQKQREQAWEDFRSSLK